MMNTVTIRFEMRAIVVQRRKNANSHTEINHRKSFCNAADANSMIMMIIFILSYRIYRFDCNRNRAPFDSIFMMTVIRVVCVLSFISHTRYIIIIVTNDELMSFTMSSPYVDSCIYAWSVFFGVVCVSLLACWSLRSVFSVYYINILSERRGTVSALLAKRTCLSLTRTLDQHNEKKTKIIIIIIIWVESDELLLKLDSYATTMAVSKQTRV